MQSGYDQQPLSQQPHIRIKDVVKRYPSGVEALKNISLDIHQGEIFGIIGRSGAGKSTLLRLLNNLEQPDKGLVQVNDHDIAVYQTKQLRALRRRVAMIFQHFNLMATKTVAQNIELPLRMAGIDTKERQQRVDEMLRLVGLESYRDSWPSQLSGGQKQRVGIARALVMNPEVLLCDEATSALDPENTLAILNLLRNINQRLGLTIVLITHEMDVIRTLCDRVAVLERGEIIEQGEVWQVFGDPQHMVTQNMLGTLHHGRTERKSLDGGLQILALFFNGSSGKRPDLATISNALGVGVSLLYSSCEEIQGRIVGQLRLAVPGESVSDIVPAAEKIADRVSLLSS